MRINRIVLCNFGSYEGENVFEFSTNEKRNIILIGGKNGAGKTTLFTAMRVCLYGYMSMGYKNANSYYNRAINKLFNNNAKMNKPSFAYVSLEIDLSNGRGLDNYILCRKWTLDETLCESFEVTKNGGTLNDEETADFEKYLLSLIPPELFNLYFFDGEKIADFFLNEGSNVRIKDAFLTLCGYDTFEIMRKNFKRISTTVKGKKRSSLEAYIEAKENVSSLQSEVERTQADLLECTTEIENCSSEILALEKDYSRKGGITQAEWDEKIFQLKDEERKREGWNAVLKKWANEIIPFIMVTSLLERIKSQIEKENSDKKFNDFIEILNSDGISALIGKKKEAIIRLAIEKYGESEERILDLSFEQSSSLIALISDLLAFDKTKVLKCKKAIKNSINKSASLRKELEQSNITTVQEYMQRRSELFERKSMLLDHRIDLEQSLQQQRESLSSASVILAKAQSALELEIKNESISDISARAIIMLDKLQADLYHKQIRKVEAVFRKIVNSLMRKTRFIDDIFIDDSFNIHVFRNETFGRQQLKDFLSSHSKDQFISTFGTRALNCLEGIVGEIQFGVPQQVYPVDEPITLPVEIDKSAFSNGEKQIFIMALYFSLVQLGNHEIPFVIDTPFARIDTEHRKNIAKYFFSELQGQVFILSTNEEITEEHVNMMHEKILSMYTLENSDNKRTLVMKDSYFEV